MWITRRGCEGRWHLGGDPWNPGVTLRIFKDVPGWVKGCLPLLPGVHEHAEGAVQGADAHGGLADDVAVGRDGLGRMRVHVEEGGGEVVHVGVMHVASGGEGEELSGNGDAAEGADEADVGEAVVEGGSRGDFHAAATGMGRVGRERDDEGLPLFAAMGPDTERGGLPCGQRAKEAHGIAQARPEPALHRGGGVMEDVGRDAHPCEQEGVADHLGPLVTATDLENVPFNRLVDAMGPGMHGGEDVRVALEARKEGDVVAGAKGKGRDDGRRREGRLEHATDHFAEGAVAADGEEEVAALGEIACGEDAAAGGLRLGGAHVMSGVPEGIRECSEAAGLVPGRLGGGIDDEADAQGTAVAGAAHLGA